MHSLSPAHTSLRPIHMFWHGPALSRLERLCMRSFLANGHRLLLHTYAPPTGVPEGVEIVDAARTLSPSLVFRDKRHNSIAAFADWFRFKVLYEQGGIWADTDVVCLKPLAYEGDEIFGWEDHSTVNVAVLGLPAKHPVAGWMLECWQHPDRFLPYDTPKNRKHKLIRRLRPGNSRPYIHWGEFGPRGFTQAARHLGFVQLAQPFWHFYPVHFSNWQTIFDATLDACPGMVEASYALHLWNEMSRRAPGFDKNHRFDERSLFERLCTRFLKSDS